MTHCTPHTSGSDSMYSDSWLLAILPPSMLPGTPRQALAILNRQIKELQRFIQVPHCPALPRRCIAIGLPSLYVPQRRHHRRPSLTKPVRADAWHVRRTTPCQILPVARARLLDITDRRIDPSDGPPLVFHHTIFTRSVQQVPRQTEVGQRAAVIRMAWLGVSGWQCQNNNQRGGGSTQR